MATGTLIHHILRHFAPLLIPLPLAQLASQPTVQKLQPQYLTILINATSEEILDDLSIQHRLAHDTLDMLRLDTSIPNPLARQRVALETGRDIHDDVSRKLVASDVTDLGDSCCWSVALHVRFHLDGVHHWCLSDDLDVLSLQLLFELVLKYGT